MEHVFFSLVLLILQPVDNAPPQIDRHEVLESYVRPQECDQALKEHTARLENGKLPPGAYLQCIPFPHRMIW